jgi:hypothetical protein
MTGKSKSSCQVAACNDAARMDARHNKKMQDSGDIFRKLINCFPYEDNREGSDESQVEPT